MPVKRQDIIDALAVREVSDLRAILEFSRVPVGAADTSRALATRIANQLWWTYATPLGLATRAITLDEIIDHVARRLRIDGALSPHGSPWSRLAEMTALLARTAGPVALEDLDPTTRERLARSWMPTVGYASGATGGFGALGAGRGVMWLAGTRVGQWLPYIPSVGPWARSAYRIGGVAAALGGPVGIALAALAVNDALGPNYPRLVPLLLGVGSLGPQAVHDAVEVAVTTIY